MTNPRNAQTLSAVKSAFTSTLDKHQVLFEPGDCWAYGYDNSRRHALPDFVCFPESADDVTHIVRTAYEYDLPVIARGRGTNTTGATVPVSGGVVVSFERMNRILSVDPNNRVLTTEPGVTNAEIQSAARAAGFFWGPDPSSGAQCAVGGNLACNAAGPRAIKYGSTRDNTLALKAVTGTGEAIRTGFQTSKGSCGYDFTRLLIGSEGTLALITEATLKLTPLPEARRTFRLLFSGMTEAASAVSKIMAQSVTPSALEFIDEASLTAIRSHSDIEIPSSARAMLLGEVDGIEAGIDDAVAQVLSAARVNGLIEEKMAKTESDVKALWALRKALSPALRHIAEKKINEDIVVPVSKMPDYMDAVQKLAKQYQIKIVNFGHAGNGNIHTNLMINPHDAAEVARAKECLAALFDIVIRFDGCLSGEHGIGMDKKPFIAKSIDATSLQLMRDVKRVFDPKGLLNPGKVLPD